MSLLVVQLFILLIALFPMQHRDDMICFFSSLDVVDRIQRKVALEFGLVVEFGISVIRCADSISPQTLPCTSKINFGVSQI